MASEADINDICLSMRHDFGLMPESEREKLRWECREWLHAIGKTLSVDSPTLPKLLDALGWQGGTVADALEEVRRLAQAQAVFVEIGKVDMLGSVVWKDFAGIDAYKRIGLKVFAVSRDKPLGQGLVSPLSKEKSTP